MSLGNILAHVRGWITRMPQRSSKSRLNSHTQSRSGATSSQSPPSSTTSTNPSSDQTSTLVLSSPSPSNLTPHPTASSSSPNHHPLIEIPPAWFARRRSSLFRISAETLKLESEFRKIERETGLLDSSGIEMELMELPPASASASAYHHPTTITLYSPSIMRHRDSAERDVQLRNMILSPFSAYFSDINTAQSQLHGFEAVLCEADIHIHRRASDTSSYVNTPTDTKRIDAAKKTVIAKISRIVQTPTRRLHRKPKHLDLRDESAQLQHMQQSFAPSHWKSSSSPPTPSSPFTGLFRLRKSPCTTSKPRPRPSHIAPIAIHPSNYGFRNHNVNANAEVESHVEAPESTSSNPRTLTPAPLIQKSRPISIRDSPHFSVDCQISDSPLTSVGTLYLDAVQETPEMVSCVSWQLQVSPRSAGSRLAMPFFHLRDVRRPSAGSVGRPGTAKSSLVLSWWD